jgi:hypothetical protein
MNNKYEIRLYNKPLVTFEFTPGAVGGFVVDNTKAVSDNFAVFPVGFEPTNDGVTSWLSRRVIPKNREFVEEILKSFGLAVNDVKGVIDVCKGLSLNDSYWVVPENFDGTFEKYNLYENRFSEVLALVAYTGVGASDPEFSTSPEFTTDGMLPKAWRFIEGDGIYLYKGGTSGYANAGLEPYSEHYASQIAAKMEIDAIPYGLAQWKGITASTCKLFSDIDTSYVQIGRIVKTGGIDATLKYYDDKKDERFYDSIRDMLVFDALIYNDDRHFGNFGVLRDNHTGEIIRPAPLFDHGLSLFSRAMPDEIKRVDDYAKTRYPAYPIVTFEDIVKNVITSRQVEQLRKMINFSFTRHPLYNLPEQRLAAIEKHLQKRVVQLLNLAKERSRNPKQNPARNSKDRESNENAKRVSEKKQSLTESLAAAKKISANRNADKPPRTPKEPER